MKSLHDRRIADNRKRTIAIILGLIVVVGFLVFFFFSNLQNTFQNIARPLWKGENNAKSNLSTFFSYFASKSNLEKENNALKSELEALKSQLIDRDTLYTENLALKNLFDRKPEGTLVLATVLVKPNKSLYDTLIIDIGTRNGVEIGDKVFAYGTVLLGEVSNVGETTATVRLFSTAGTTFTGRVAGLNIDADVTGRGGSNFEMTLPREVIVPEGTLILMPSISEEIVAVTGKSISDQRDPFQKVLLTSPVNINELGSVLVRI